MESTFKTVTVPHRKEVVYHFTCLCGQELKVKKNELTAWNSEVECPQCCRKIFLTSHLGEDFQIISEDIIIEEVSPYEK